MWNSDEWIDSVQALAGNRDGWAKLCSRTAHLDKDAVAADRNESNKKTNLEFSFHRRGHCYAVSAIRIYSTFDRT
ncbi:hypothetical protein RB195_014331 [Necator americanus]|uniref:Uncharacterized protein n=1 Tax=Necator americanus TaxID=51031 RepID=A0ABR1E037_NECAM